MAWSPTLRRLAVLVGMIGGLGLPGLPGVAGTTNLLVTGQLFSESSAAVEGGSGGIDGSTFELRLAFDEPTLPDPERSTFSTPTLTYVAEAWSLAYFRGTEIVAEYDQDANPEAVGFAVLAGRQDLFDGETTVELGVDAGPVSASEVLSGSLIDATFFTPTLVDTFFTDRLADLPSDLSLVSGVAFDEVRQLGVPIVEAALSAVSIDDAVIVDAGEVIEGGGPNVVPTPSAVAGGVLLMAGLAARRWREG